MTDHPQPTTDFRGVVALELSAGHAPGADALDAQASGELVAMLGRDLASLADGVRTLDLALLGAHFDPAEALRPGWPLHRRALELLQRAPDRAAGPRMVGFGADAAGVLPQPLRCDPDLRGGGLRVLPFVLHGAAAGAVGVALEAVLLDRGMAPPDTALALQDGLGARIEHVRYLSLHDLAAMIAMQYANVGLQPLWTLLETALLQPAAEAWLESGPEPFARYVDGEVRIALFDPEGWRQRHAPAEEDPRRLERGFEMYQARQRQFAAVLQAHAVPVQFVHCPAGRGTDCLA